MVRVGAKGVTAHPAPSVRDTPSPGMPDGAGRSLAAARPSGRREARDGVACGAWCRPPRRRRLPVQACGAGYAVSPCGPLAWRPRPKHLDSKRVARQFGCRPHWCAVSMRQRAAANQARCAAASIKRIYVEWVAGGGYNPPKRAVQPLVAARQPPALRPTASAALYVRRASVSWFTACWAAV